MAQRKIIGYVITAWQNQNVAVDLYEGNRVIMPDGSAGKVPDDVYKDLASKYEAAGGNIESAYAYNSKHGISVPEASAKPDMEFVADGAAEKASREQAQRAEAEKKQKEESERKKREEESKKQKVLEEQKRQEAEKQRKEQERKRQEEKQRQEQAAREKAEQEKKRREEEQKEREEKQRILDEQAKEQLRIQQEKERKEKEERERAARASAKPAEPAKKSKAPVIIGIVLLIIVIMAIAGFAFVYLNGSKNDSSQNSAESQTATEETVESTEESVSSSNAEETPATEYVVAALATDVPMSQMISETDLKGVILTAEQYEEYTSKTYISSDGSIQYVSLIMWDDKDSIIGMYAAQDMSENDLVYDTSLTSQHVIADKTYVEVEVDGQTGIVETEGTDLPGSTDIKIVAVITTEGSEPVQVLLSEMTLQDRSLESIFNSAGQDILDQLAQISEESTEESSEETTESTEGQQ